MADPKKLLDEAHRAIGLCDRIEKAQRGRRMKKRFVAIWNWIWRIKPKQPDTSKDCQTLQFPFQKKG